MHRRHFLRATIGSSVALALAPASGFGSLLRSAAAQNGDQQRVVLVDALNLREGPGLGYGVVASLNQGDIVSITSDVTWADGYGWVQVAVYGTSTSGWVAAEFIGSASDDDSSSIGLFTYVHVATDGLNLRSSAGLGDNVIGTYSRNTNAEVTGSSVAADGYAWWPVHVSDGSDGWFAGGFLVPGLGDASQTPSQVYMHVNTDALNLRSGAGLGNGVIATYPYNTEALVIGSSVSADGYSWLPVRVPDGAEGWFAEEFLAPGYAAAPKDRVRVTDGPLNVRWEPGLDSEAFITVPTGAYGTVLDPRFVDADGYSWVYVQWDDSAVIGWVATNFVSYIDVG